MRIVWNAPFVLSFAVLSLFLLVIHIATDGQFTVAFVIARADFDPTNVGMWSGLVLHMLGHGNLAHFFGNMSLILLLGPILEREYGSRRLAAMTLATALVTGAANIAFFSVPIIGSSGIVFMMMMLTAVQGARERTIPVTFIIVVIFFTVKELHDALFYANISHFAHLAGGAAGTFFGFFLRKRQTPAP